MSKTMTITNIQFSDTESPGIFRTLAMLIFEHFWKYGKRHRVPQFRCATDERIDATTRLGRQGCIVL